MDRHGKEGRRHMMKAGSGASPCTVAQGLPVGVLCMVLALSLSGGGCARGAFGGDSLPCGDQGAGDTGAGRREVVDVRWSGDVPSGIDCPFDSPLGEMVPPDSAAPEVSLVDLSSEDECSDGQEPAEITGDGDASVTDAGLVDSVDLNGEMECVHPDVVENCGAAGWCTIPAGCFMMGSPLEEIPWAQGEKQHQVTLTNGFEIRATEVTISQFQSVMGYDPSAQKACGGDCPANLVNWHEALSYCNALSSNAGQPECFDCTGVLPDVQCVLKSAYPTPQECPGYRLPTEAEWEYAARAGTTTAFYSGDIVFPEGWEVDPNLDQIGWYFANADVSYDGCADLSWKAEDPFEWMFTCMGIHPVGMKKSNGWGLLDMSGNVYEWAWDWYGDYGAEAVDPFGPSSGPGRVIRGGSWYG